LRYSSLTRALSDIQGIGMSDFAFGNPVLCIPEEYKALKIEAQYLEEDFVTLHRMDLQSISHCPQRVLEAQRFMLLYISLYIVHFGSYVSFACWVLTKFKNFII
jgi:hypothetical protein